MASSLPLTKSNLQPYRSSWDAGTGGKAANSSSASLSSSQEAFGSNLANPGSLQEGSVSQSALMSNSDSSESNFPPTGPGSSPIEFSEGRTHSMPLVENKEHIEYALKRIIARDERKAKYENVSSDLTDKSQSETAVASTSQVKAENPMDSNRSEGSLNNVEDNGVVTVQPVTSQPMSSTTPEPRSSFSTEEHVTEAATEATSSVCSSVIETGKSVIEFITSIF